MLSAPSAHSLACSTGSMASAASRSVCTAQKTFRLGSMFKSQTSIWVARGPNCCSCYQQTVWLAWLISGPVLPSFDVQGSKLS